MIAAGVPVQRPSNAKLLVVDGLGNIGHRARSEFVNVLRPGDVVIANDAATCRRAFRVAWTTGWPIEYVLRGAIHSMRSGYFPLSFSARVTFARARRSAESTNIEPRRPVGTGTAARQSWCDC